VSLGVGGPVSFNRDNLKRSDHQACSPLAACFRFPQPGLRMAAPPLHGLLETMDTTFGIPGLLGYMSNALLAEVTKTVENTWAFVPKSHVGLCSAG